MSECLCRVCGKHIHNLNSRNLFNNEDNEILNKIQALTGIWLIDEPDMPNIICDRCYWDVNNAMAFRIRCIKTHHDFQLRSRELKETENDLVAVSDDVDNLIIYEADYFITDLNENVDFNEMQSTLSNVLESSSSVPTIENSQVNPISSSDTKDSQEKTSLGLNKQRIETRNNTGKRRVYYCDQCGNHFHCLSNLKVHLIRHAGIRHYECEECGHKEYTSYLLKVHIRIEHKGEKPFGCKYCSEAFSSRQKRATHQRTHEDEETKAKRRKFKCSLCIRSFTNKETLKKHEIVHSGERPFGCETCHVYFNRKSNLVSHYRSKLHMKKLGQLSEVSLVQKSQTI